MIIGGQSVARHLLTEFLIRDPPIFDGDLAVLALQLSLAYHRSDGLPVLALCVFFEAPFLELSYVLCLDGTMIRGSSQ